MLNMCHLKDFPFFCVAHNKEEYGTLGEIREAATSHMLKRHL